MLSHPVRRIVGIIKRRLAQRCPLAGERGPLQVAGLLLMATCREIDHFAILDQPDGHTGRRKIGLTDAENHLEWTCGSLRSAAFFGVLFVFVWRAYMQKPPDMLGGGA